MTWVTMTPKVEGVNEIQQFRSINMIRSIYKVIYKILANRMKSVMPNLVSESKSAFISRR